MLRRFLFLLTMAIAMSGCAGYQDTSRQRMQGLTQHYSQFDLEMGWNYRVADGTTLIDGMVKNVRFQVMYDLEIRVEVVAPKQKVTARAVTLVIPRQLNLDESAPFSLKLPLAVQPGNRLVFTYRYRGNEGGGFGSGLEAGTDWMQSFEAVVPQK